MVVHEDSLDKSGEASTPPVVLTMGDVAATETASNADAVSVVDDTTSQVDSLMESDTIGNVLVDPSKGELTN